MPKGKPLDRAQKIEKWSAVAEMMATAETIRCPFCDEADLDAGPRGVPDSSFFVRCPACKESTSIRFSREVTLPIAKGSTP